MGKETVCGDTSKRQMVAEEGEGKMVWGDEESPSPKSESRTLFGVGLGHSFPFFPCQGQEAHEPEVP